MLQAPTVARRGDLTVFADIDVFNRVSDNGLLFNDPVFACAQLQREQAPAVKQLKLTEPLVICMTATVSLMRATSSTRFET